MVMDRFDLLIVGGGSSGAALAYEAVRRGLRVALLEAGDPGQGTSSRSTKLLHGGVRYLELAFKQLDAAQLKLVREALSERQYWIDQAPFLAQPLRIALPTQGPIEQAYYRMGLGMYDLLAGSAGLEPSCGINRQQLQAALPGLDPERHGAVLYSDGQFDDARLNLLLLLTAESAGAVVQRDCPVVDFEHEGGQVVAAVTRGGDGSTTRWPARCIVNATGIQADHLRALAQPNCRERLLVSRGVHLVLEQQLCPAGTGLLIPKTSDGRVMFVLPFQGRTLVGTTDSPCAVGEATTVSAAEETFLMDHLRRWFPGQPTLTVSSRWAGGRPLIQPDSDRGSSKVVREHEVERLDCGLISLLGGKWTTCRVLALDALKAIAAELNQTLPAPMPLPLLGAASSPEQTLASLAALRARLEPLTPTGPLQRRQIDHLIANYGLQAEQVLEQAMDSSEAMPLSAVVPVCLAEWRYNIRFEWAKTSADLLERRSRIAFLDQAEAERLTPEAESLLLASSISPINHQPKP